MNSPARRRQRKSSPRRVRQTGGPQSHLSGSGPVKRPEFPAKRRGGSSGQESHGSLRGSEPSQSLLLRDSEKAAPQGRGGESRDSADLLPPSQGESYNFLRSN